MEYDLNYCLNKYPGATWSNIKNTQRDSKYTITCISSVVSHDVCKQCLEAAKIVTTHVILAEPLGEDANRAVKEFVSKNNYVAYKIDDVVRIFLV
jgi:hypothetical protein